MAQALLLGMAVPLPVTGSVALLQGEAVLLTQAEGDRLLQSVALAHAVSVEEPEGEAETVTQLLTVLLLVALGVAD